MDYIVYGRKLSVRGTRIALKKFALCIFTFIALAGFMRGARSTPPTYLTVRQAPRAMPIYSRQRLEKLQAERLRVSVCAEVERGSRYADVDVFTYEESEQVARIRSQLSQGKRKLVVGAGSTDIQNWISSDYPVVNLLNHTRIGALFGEVYLDAILAEHVFEHFTLSEAVIALQAAWCILKSDGGRFRIAVPDANHPGKHFTHMVYGAWAVRHQGNGYPGHHTGWTISQLTRILHASGFQVTPLEWWDSDQYFYIRDWDAQQGGPISRSAKHDRRNADGGLNYTSLLVDAFRMNKPPDK